MIAQVIIFCQNEKKNGQNDSFFGLDIAKLALLTNKNLDLQRLLFFQQEGHLTKNYFRYLERIKET